MDVLEPEQGFSVRGTSDDTLLSGDVLRKLLVKLEKQVDLQEPLPMPPCAPNSPVKVRKRASRRAVKGAGRRARGGGTCAAGGRKADALV